RGPGAEPEPLRRHVPPGASPRSRRPAAGGPAVLGTSPPASRELQGHAGGGRRSGAPRAPALIGGRSVIDCAMPAHEFIVFGQPDIRPEDIQEVVATLESLWIGTGPRTHEFERRFAAYVDAPHAVATSSGTAALHLGLIALGVGAGHEVVVPAMTFP